MEKLTDKERLLILANSFGQLAELTAQFYVYEGYLNGIQYLNNGDALLSLCPHGNAKINQSGYSRQFTLLKKPLSQITNEHKLAIAKIEMPSHLLNWKVENGECFETTTGFKMHFGDTIDRCLVEVDNIPGGDERLSLHALQQLQEWGYALPHKHYSIEQLVELGIYKIVE